MRALRPDQRGPRHIGTSIAPDEPLARRLLVELLAKKGDREMSLQELQPLRRLQAAAPSLTNREQFVLAAWAAGAADEAYAVAKDTVRQHPRPPASGMRSPRRRRGEA